MITTLPAKIGIVVMGLYFLYKVYTSRKIKMWSSDIMDRYLGIRRFEKAPAWFPAVVTLFNAILLTIVISQNFMVLLWAGVALSSIFSLCCFIAMKSCREELTAYSQLLLFLIITFAVAVRTTICYGIIFLLNKWQI